jgi:hypothetical protein
MNLLDYLRNPQTQQMVQQWGERLEKLTICDKLDALWTIATHIGHCEQAGEIKMLSDTQSEYGCLIDGTTDSESFLTLLEQGNPSIEDLIAIIACLANQMYHGIYQEEPP